MEGEDDKAQEIFTFKLSSEAPAEMWPGVLEVMGHKAHEADLTWFKSGNAPLLWMHDRHQQIGVIVDARLIKDALEVDVRFGTSALAQEKKSDVEAGILKNVSIGYRVHEWEEVEMKDGDSEGMETYRATQWEGLEGSFVSIPADKTVGIDRSARSPKELLSEQQEEPKRSQTKTKTMSNDTPLTQADVDSARQAGQQEAAVNERARIEHITRAAKGTKGYDLTEISERAIGDGTSADKFNAEVLEFMRSNAPKLDQSSLGASKKDQQRYSITNVLDGIANGDLASRAPYELEMSNELKKAQGKADSSSVAIPVDILVKSMVRDNPERAATILSAFGVSLRDLNSVTLNGANQSDHVANLVDVELMSDMFVYSLRETNALLNSGVTIIGGLVGDAEIPLELLNPQFHWIGEDEEPDAGKYNTGKVGLSFKTLAARVAYTRRAAKQSTPGIDSLLARSLRIGAGLALESNFYSGAGTATEPEGILNTAGIGIVPSGGKYSRESLVRLRAALGTANATNGGAKLFMSEAAAAEYVLTVDETGDRYVAQYASDDPTMINTVIGNGCISNLVPNLAQGGTNNTVLYGKPSSLYCGMWGTLEVDQDDTTDRATGGKNIRVFLDADTAIPQPANWAAISDLTV